MQKRTIYQIFLIIIFAIVWIWAAINPKYPHDWLLENYLVFIFVPLIIITGIYFRLSNISYTLITIFMILHVIGSHYTYSDVPFGFTLQEWFNSNRNMYDRFVHFSFGLFLAYPIREVFLRLAKTKGIWGFLLPIEFTLATSTIYEIIEWLTAIVVEPSAGLAFLGSQGDIWDAQKDMLLAGIGAFFTMSLTTAIHIKYNKNFLKEVKESLMLSKKDEILGEVKLEKMIKRK